MAVGTDALTIGRYSDTTEVCCSCTVAWYLPIKGEIVADDPSIRGAGDRQRINVDQDYELQYWSERLGVSAEELRQAVKNVGPMADAVETHLRGRSAHGRSGT